MKTKEFIARVEDLGLYTEIDYIADTMLVHDGQGIVATVSMLNQFEMSTGYYIFKATTEIKSKLLKILVEYTTTPIEERESPQKYRLKLKPLELKIIGTNRYLAHDELNEEYILIDRRDGYNLVKNKFTFDEILELDRNFDILSTFNAEVIEEEEEL